MGGSTGYGTERKRALAMESRMNKYVLKLYITGQTPKSERTIATMRRICEEELAGQYELVTIDVLECPQLAEDERIMATPTVIKALPRMRPSSCSPGSAT